MNGAFLVAVLVLLCSSSRPARAEPPVVLWSLDPNHDEVPQTPPRQGHFFGDSVADDHVVLVARDDCVGAFVLSGQRTNPDAAKVQWVCRKRGVGHLGLKDPDCTSGGGWLEEENDWRIRFGAFDLRWRHKWFLGRIEYGADWGTSVCFTNLRSLDDVNPLDPRWVYRRHPHDPGRCFARDATSIEPRPKLVAVVPGKSEAGEKDGSSGLKPGAKGDDGGTVVKIPTRQGIEDGVVVLVTDGFRCGAFALREQRQEQQRPGAFRDAGAYDWWLRRDGFGRLDPEDTAVDRGHGALGGGDASEEVRFGAIYVHWGAASPSGAGHLSFRGEYLAFSDVDYYLCVTDRTDLRGLDAQDPKWVYKHSADDPGWRFEKPQRRK